MKKILFSILFVTIVCAVAFAAGKRFTAQCNGNDGVSYVVAESDGNYVVCDGYGKFYNSSVIVGFTSHPESSKYETVKVKITNGTSGRVKVANYVIYNLTVSNPVCN
ncbi:MAG: hypothetical protein K2G27_10200 [Duncaniella sp.]|nr:hypothetical protein [Bacteroides sp.]MDE6067178.1 hypothetical protein [Duncaniella sp.]